jgi:hypothetical protein
MKKSTSLPSTESISRTALSERMQLVVSPGFTEKIDKWRAAQPDVPNKSEAIRRIVELFLAKPT